MLWSLIKQYTTFLSELEVHMHRKYTYTDQIDEAFFTRSPHIYIELDIINVFTELIKALARSIKSS